MLCDHLFQISLVKVPWCIMSLLKPSKLWSKMLPSDLLSFMVNMCLFLLLYVMVVAFSFLPTGNSQRVFCIPVSCQCVCRQKI